MTTRDNRGLDITRDLNKITTPGEGLDAETSLGQTIISIDTAELGSAAPDPAADYLPFYDLSAGAHKRILPQNLPAAAGSAEGCVVSTFTADGTWVKPSGASGVYVIVIAGGGGGGGGGYRTTSYYQSGAGGGGGGITWAWLAASDLPDTVEVTVGAGGTGGTSTSTGNTAGGNGGAGGFSAFGKIKATGGGGGQGGRVDETQANGGSGGGGLYSGITASATDDDTNVTQQSDGDVNCGAGGSAGGREVSTLRTGSRGSHVNGYPLTAAGGGTIGTSTLTGTGGDGGAGASQPAGTPLPGAGGGPGGAGGNGGGFRGGDGGAGGLYGAGGGGGGCLAISGDRSGAGGAGAQGIVVVYTFL